MKRGRFTETRIVSILKEADAGGRVKDICRQHGISDATYYNWKSKYGGMQASDLKRLKETEAELSQYKKMYAELARENYALKDREKALRPLEKRCGHFLVAEHKLSKTRACNRDVPIELVSPPPSPTRSRGHGRFEKYPRSSTIS